MSITYLSRNNPVDLTFVVREEKREYTKHDSLFKQLIGTFFAEFLEAFFPTLHRQIDFAEIKSIMHMMVINEFWI
jgi:hypothetical protein